MIYVENVSAKQKKKKNNTRFFSEKKNPLRQDGYTKKARERKSSPLIYCQLKRQGIRQK
ncbi:MAG: hypothetical protein UX22_C0006G0002 [Candidatus Jorgensenbacteria bacterium GW2011_GWA2_45_9]|uniref:Uncharacterized protein n=1 Tax=Candidatus Jorgensenbacteria bacterium GW2011_GWA2_45_9 TaxID=1618663 RepID=A0A0G1N502_9BACT|nr:MAG: hypothetical protein UX22_C0006G0002 [Candidatus Jorgensenbacteria bacterium GW2011_GWA2_45_9]